MIALLRKKFIFITMWSVILVLAVLMGIVNITNYIKINQSADEMLQVLLENDGEYPNINKPMEDPPTPDNSPIKDSSSKPADDSALDRRPNVSPETPYEIRYFSVGLESDGTSSFADTGRIAAISAEEAVTMAQKLLRSGKISGYDGNYRYLAKKVNQETLYVFLDCTRDLSSFREFFSISLFVSFCGILTVFLMVLVLSKRAIRPMAESYNKQRQFITNAGHEIKTPLAIIDSCTEVIEIEQGSNKWTEGIREQVQRMNALTQNLISLARMDEGSNDLSMEKFSLSDLVSEVLHPFVLLAENSGLLMSVEIQPDLWYCGNKPLLCQLCSVLVDNAVKYALPGSEIYFDLKKKGKRLVLTCKNAAEGLTIGDQNTLFDRFYRGDMSRSSGKGSYGIGLSMAQSIVTAHDGKITARSEDGASLTVTVQL